MAPPSVYKKPLAYMIFESPVLFVEIVTCYRALNKLYFFQLLLRSEKLYTAIHL